MERGPVLAVLAVLTGATPAAVPRLDVVMVRAGLLVSVGALDHTDRLFDVLNVPLVRRCGV